MQHIWFISALFGCGGEGSESEVNLMRLSKVQLRWGHYVNHQHQVTAHEEAMSRLDLAWCAYRMVCNKLGTTDRLLNQQSVVQPRPVSILHFRCSSHHTQRHDVSQVGTLVACVASVSEAQ